ncbi:hypothetical protein MHYP_G00098150 [Metynnis hypsauchen]
MKRREIRHASFLLVHAEQQSVCEPQTSLLPVRVIGRCRKELQEREREREREREGALKTAFSSFRRRVSPVVLASGPTFRLDHTRRKLNQR